MPRVPPRMTIRPKEQAKRSLPVVSVDGGVDGASIKILSSDSRAGRHVKQRALCLSYIDASTYDLLQLILEPEDSFAGHIDRHSRVFIRYAGQRLHPKIGHQIPLVQKWVSFKKPILNLHCGEVVVLEIIGSLEGLHPQGPRLCLRLECANIGQECGSALVGRFQESQIPYAKGYTALGVGRKFRFLWHLAMTLYVYTCPHLA